MRARLIRFLSAALACLALAACAELQVDPGPAVPAPRTAERPAPPASAPSTCPAPAPAPRAVREPAPGPSRTGTPSDAWFNLRDQGLSSWNDLRTPLLRSLSFLESRPAEVEAVRRGCFRPTWGQLAESARELLELLPRLDAEPQLLAERFLWLAVQPGPVMTAYYTPEVPASLTRRTGYEHPLYGPPPELAQADLPLLPDWPGAESNPPSRGASDAERRGVAVRGPEIAWARDPLDVFFMQVEGSGILRLPDGRTKTAHYAASNGRRFRSLGDILAERGLLAPDRRGRKAVRRFFRENPNMAGELMAENRRFVFFRLGDGPPVGALGKPLTPFVSVATDPNLLPLGSVLVLEAETPDPSGRGTRRIRGPVLPQDVGSAIKGARLDFYMGEGAAVEDAADRVKNRVTAYMLLSKNALAGGSR